MMRSLTTTTNNISVTLVHKCIEETFVMHGQGSYCDE